MMTIAEKLLAVDANTKRVEALNAELEQSLYSTDTGGKSYYDEFWDTFQDYGKRRYYGSGCFGGISWYDARFKPKYDIRFMGNINTAFAVSNIQDFKGCIERAGIIVNFDGVISATELFSYSQVTRLPTLDFSKLTITLNYTFNYCTYLKSIDKIIINENIKFYNPFFRCDALEEIRIEGVIASNGFDLQWSTKLSRASITSIINALSTSTSGLSVTLSKTAVNNVFTTDEWNALANTKTNWTISLV
jgi:hypothetical protein